MPAAPASYWMSTAPASCFLAARYLRKPRRSPQHQISQRPLACGQSRCLRSAFRIIQLRLTRDPIRRPMRHPRRMRQLKMPRVSRQSWLPGCLTNECRDSGFGGGALRGPQGSLVCWPPLRPLLLSFGLWPEASGLTGDSSLERGRVSTVQLCGRQPPPRIQGQHL